VRTLADLLASDDGLALLEERGVVTDAAAFAERLRPPVRTDLADLLDIDPRGHLVYTGQQVCADMAAPTAAKFVAARELAALGDITAAILWHDMDSTRSDRYAARFVLPGPTRSHGAWLVPRRRVESADVEPRFLATERAVIEAAFAQLADWACSRHDAPETPRAKVAQLAAAATADDGAPLAQVTRAIATVLLSEEVGLEGPSVAASEMVGAGLLVDAVEEYLSNIDDVVRAFNEAVAELLDGGIDPQVRPLPPDYLPLRYSCPDDDTRLRLGSERRGNDVLAVATCRCGRDFAFNLGGDGATLDDLRVTGRWSIDVSMPVHHNELASGWIAGRSTALYGLVLNEVLRRVLAREPVPVFVPAGLADDSEDETLLIRHLVSSEPRLATS